MALSQPSTPKKYTMQYQNLKGVDFSKDQTSVDRYHSPDMVNMVSDVGGNPCKRIGWRKIVGDNENGAIIDFLVREENGSGVLYLLREKTLERTDLGASQTSVVITTPYSDGTFSKDSQFIQFKGDVLLFTNVKGFACIYKIASDGKITTLKISDGLHDQLELDNVTIPQVLYGRASDGSAGTSYYDTNLLTRFREYSFLGTSSDTTFYFYPTTLRSEDAYKWLVKGSVKVKALTESGEIDLVEGSQWNYTGSDETVSGFDENGNVAQYVVRPTAITISSGLLNPDVTGKGQDNLRIVFKPFNGEEITLDGVTSKQGLYYAKAVDVFSPRASATFGHSAIDRLFIAGGRELNTVYFSDVEDPTYFPDLNYITVGQSTNGIIGFHRVSSYLVALKDDASAESTAFLISGYIYDEGGVNERTTFGVTPMTSGVGAIAKQSFGTLRDEPLFLSRTGVYGITSTYTATEKNINNRSGFVNKVLLAEKDLSKACATVWNNYYLLAINGHVYALDGRQQTADPDGGSTYFYEAYYWTNVPAVRMQAHHGDLWFLSSDNQICRFNTDIDNNTKYSDDGTLVNGKIENGKAIKCRWASCLDDCYRPQYLKTMTKRGALITIAPHERTSVTITVVKDGVDRHTLEPFMFDISDWNSINFDTFVISTSNIAEDAFLKKKTKKFKRIQLIVENNETNEPFGLLNIVYTYNLGNLAKK